MKPKLKYQILFALLLPICSARAQYADWTNAGSGNWFTPENWSLGAPPSSSTDAMIGMGLAEISSGTAQARQIYLGSGGTGAMTISNGAALETGLGVDGAYYTVIGYGNGSATVTGSNSIWTFGVPIHVGTLGTGSISIENGGKLQQSDTSNWGNSVTIGGYAGNGSVSISGAGSSLSTRNSAGMHIGNDQQGSLHVSNGGSASVGYAYIGGNAGSNGSVTVAGTNSNWTIYNSMSIANTNGAAGSLAVSAGGNVTVNGEIYLGRDGQAAVTVTGSGSKLLAGASTSNDRRGNIFLADGQTGSATLTVADGALLQSNPSNSFRTLYLAKDHATSQATLQIGNGGKAGTVDVAAIHGGAGTAKLIFNHSDADYVFNPGITGSTSLIHSGTGTTRLVGSKSYSGGTTINAGTLSIFAAGHIGSGDVTIGGGTLRISSGAVDFGSRAFSLTSSLSTIETVASDLNGGYSSAFIGGVISGNGRLIKTGGGELTLTGNNSHTGGTVIEEGTLRIGYLSTSGMVAGDIENNGHLEFNRVDNVTFSGAISGSGDLTKWGYGGLTLTNANTYTGATFVKSGTLTVSGSISGAGGLVTIDAGATLNGSGTVNRDILVHGTLASSVVVTGQVTLSSESQVAVGDFDNGDVTADSGTQLVIGSATGGAIDASSGTASIGTLAGSSLNLGNWGGTVNTLSSGTITTSGGSVVAQQGNFSGSISGTGGLTKSGSGTLTLTSANTYSGATMVTGGTLTVAAAGATGSLAAPVRIMNNGKFRVEAGLSTSTEVTGEVISSTVGAEYEKVFNAGEGLENFGNFSSDFGSLDATSYFGAGTVDVGSALSASYSDAGSHALMSQILTLDGLDGTTFLLVMEAASIPSNADPAMFFLAWLDETDGIWKNAVDGNHGGAGSLAGAYADTSYQDFLNMNEGWHPESMLGAYGVDGASGQVWAVIDHNSQFAAIPEPQSLVLLGFGWCALLIRRRL